jgi:hypothetical protein
VTSAKDKYRAAKKEAEVKAKAKGKEPEPYIPVVTDWEAPLPLGPTTSEAVPKFPLHIFHDKIGEAVDLLAQAVQCPIDYAATSALSVAAGCIGATRKVEIKDGYTHTARLNLVLVGPSYAKKSPAMRKLMEPVRREQDRRSEAGLLCRVINPREKHPQLKIYPPGEGELYVTDMTAEGLAELLYCQRRGLIIHSDEILGWLLGQNQYRGGKGGDRQQFLTLADGGNLTIVRKGSKNTISLSAPTVTLMGSVQPARLPELFQFDDGFAERFCWCYPKELPEQGEDGKKWETSHWVTWRETCRKLWSIPMDLAEPTLATDQNPEPPCPRHTQDRKLRLTESAWEVWCEMRDALAKECNDPLFPPQLRSFWGKSKDLCARLSLIIELLDWASTPGREHDPEPTTVSGVSMAKAAEVTEYFRKHAAKVIGIGHMDSRIPDVEAVWRWIINGKRWTFTRAEAWASLCRNKRFSSIEKLNGPLNYLCKLNWLRAVDRPFTGLGRPPLPEYHVHPEKQES